MTVATLLDDSLSLAMTRPTLSSLLHHTEHGLHSLTDLTLTTTARTRLGLTSATTTVMTRDSTIELDLASGSPDSILQGYPQSHLDILTDISSLP